MSTLRNDEDFFRWLWYEATDKEKELYQRVEGLGDLFSDMLFKKDSVTGKLTRCNIIVDGQVRDYIHNLPDEIEGFDYCKYYYAVRSLDGFDGMYEPGKATLTVDPESMTDETILHEMIHLHEGVLNDLPLYFHDMVIFALYSDLKSKISDLDEIITNHAHILTGKSLEEKGGTHDILFLLKSFDLDIRKGYPLGTVFAYSNDVDFSQYHYNVEV